MEWHEHLRLTGGALKNWLVAQTQDAVLVGVLWWIGLWLLHVPWAPLWALLGGLLQYIPNLGPVLGLIGPAAAGLLSDKPERALYVLILYAVIVVVDGLLLQPYLMKRTVKIPIWASLLAPIVFGIMVPFWGVVFAAPVLAIVYAYKARHSKPAEVIPFPRPDDSPTLR